MADRKELGQTEDPKELILGNPQAIYENAWVLCDRHKDVDADGEALKRISTGAWKGKAHDSWADQANAEPPKWLQVANAVEAGSNACERYADCLQWAQRKAAEAIAHWKQGEAATAQAKADHEQAVTDTQTQPTPEQCVAPPPFNDTGEAERQAAREILNNARQQVQEMGDDLAGSLNDLAETAPKEEESTAATVGHTVLSVVGFVPGIGEVADLGNAAWYAAQGNTGDAALSAAAAVPVAGWAATAGKVGKVVYKGAKATEEGAEAYVKTARSATAARDLNRELASESQMMEKGRPIIGARTSKELDAAQRLSDTYGGQPGDWAKMSSSRYKKIKGPNFEVHWYENVQTGQRVEPKTKFLIKQGK